MTEGITPKEKETEVPAANNPPIHRPKLAQKRMKMVHLEVKADIHGRAKVQVRRRGKAKEAETNTEIEMIVVLARTAPDLNTADPRLVRRSEVIDPLEMIEVAASRVRPKEETGGPRATGAMERAIDEMTDEKSTEKKRWVRLRVRGRLATSSRSEDVTTPVEIRKQQVSREATCVVKAPAQAEGTEMTGAGRILQIDLIIDLSGNGLETETAVVSELQVRHLAQASVWKGRLVMARAMLRGGLPTDTTHRQAL